MTAPYFAELAKKRIIKLAQKRWLIGALKEQRWHKSRTAKLMQISRPTLDAWIRKYGLKKPVKRNGDTT